MAETLQNLLSAYKAATLASMAAFNNLPVRLQKGKEAYLQSLVEYFNSRSHVQAVYPKLSGAEREVVATILRQGGRASTFSLYRYLQSCQLVDTSPGRRTQISPSQPNFRLENSRNFGEIIARLQAHGLIFGVQARNPYGQYTNVDFNPVQEYVIPDSIRNYLPAPQPVAEWAPPEVGLEGPVMEGSARTFQRDLYFYWSYVHSSPVQLTGKGQILKRHLVALNETLLVRETIATGQGESDFPRLFFLRQMLVALKALARTNSALEAQADPYLFSQPPLDRIKACLEIFRSGNLVNELLTVPGITIRAEAAPALPTPDLVIAARNTVLNYLKAATHWIKFDQLSQHIREDNYEFLFKRTYMTEDYRSYYAYASSSHPYSAYTNPLGWDFYGVTGDSDGWEKVEKLFIHTILEGPLYWMGLIDLGSSQPGQARPDLFRLTSAGAWLLAGSHPPEINLAGGRVILQPNFQVTAFDPVSDDVLLNLERFAERVSTDRAVELRLTQSSVYNAQLQGWDDQRITAYLEELTGVPVPENIRRTLQDWQTLHERITVYPKVALLHAASPADLDALEHNHKLREWIGSRPDPSVLLIKGRDSVPRVVQSLVDEAWLPLISTGQHKQLPKVVEIDAEGFLKFSIPDPDLYFHGHLRRFADPVDGQTYRLSVPSVQRAIRNGMTAHDIIAALGQVTIAEIPPVLENRILAWSGHFGDVQIEETILVQMQNTDRLKELFDDPEIGPLLKPISSARAEVTASVDPKDLPRLRQLLDEKGIRQI